MVIQTAPERCRCQGCAAGTAAATGVAAEPLMTIGEVARQAQVTTSALRFYEAERLVVPASRTTAGYRLYAPEQVDHIRFIRRAQRLGLTLAEVREVLAAAHGTQPLPVREQVRALVAQKIGSVRQQVDELQEFADMLERVHRRLDGPGAGDCTDVTACSCLSMERAPTVP